MSRVKYTPVTQVCLAPKYMVFLQPQPTLMGNKQQWQLHQARSTGGPGSRLRPWHAHSPMCDLGPLSPSVAHLRRKGRLWECSDAQGASAAGRARLDPRDLTWGSSASPQLRPLPRPPLFPAIASLHLHDFDIDLKWAPFSSRLTLSKNFHEIQGSTLWGFSDAR